MRKMSLFLLLIISFHFILMKYLFYENAPGQHETKQFGKEAVFDNIFVNFKRKKHTYLI